MKPTREVVAGVIEASCSCCTQVRALINHVQLGPTRMFCPETGRTYLDRGDGLFQSDGQMLPPELGKAVAAEQIVARGEAPPPASDLLSDRPARTTDKTRITLERATFA